MPPAATVAQIIVVDQFMQLVDTAVWRPLALTPVKTWLTVRPDGALIMVAQIDNTAYSVASDSLANTLSQM